MHYSSQLDEQFTVVFMTVSHSAQMLLKLEKCIPISHVTLETVPKYANIEPPTSSQLYASCREHFKPDDFDRTGQILVFNFPCHLHLHCIYI